MPPKKSAKPMALTATAAETTMTAATFIARLARQQLEQVCSPQDLQA